MWDSHFDLEGRKLGQGLLIALRKLIDKHRVLMKHLLQGIIHHFAALLSFLEIVIFGWSLIILFIGCAFCEDGLLN